MPTEYTNNQTQKTLASFIVILAIVMVTVGVSALTHKKSSVASSTASPITSTAAGTSNTNTPATTPAATTTSPTSAYKDGSYTASSMYQTPGGQEGMSVNLTVQNGTVSNVTVQNQSNNRESQAYQSSFVAAYKMSVVGKKLSDINVLGVSGSSLTESGFDDALTQIKSQAQTA